MAQPPPRRGHPVRGLVQLTTQATLGLADLVEALHARVLSGPLDAGATAPDRTGGLTGLVYRSIRGVTHAVGAGADQLLATLEPALARLGGLPQGDALRAALNGVLGDVLERTHNPLALPMTLRQGGRDLVLEKDSLAQALPAPDRPPLILIHGLCMNDLQWQRSRTDAPGGSHDHGAALARDLGFTPLYLRYNTGLHISRNGQMLATLLESLLTQWPGETPPLTLLTHSMGGLVARSALHYGDRAGHRWPASVSDLICLGSPHLGAPLERMGHVFETILAQTPYAAPFARLAKLRSEGITDLRHGSVLAEDWEGRDRHGRQPATARHLPLPQSLRCYAVAGSIGQQRDDLKGRVLGDGLVPLRSALGQHRDPRRTLAFPADRQWIAHGVHHMDLLGDAEVYAQLLCWLKAVRSVQS